MSVNSRLKMYLKTSWLWPLIAIGMAATSLQSAADTEVTIKVGSSTVKQFEILKDDFRYTRTTGDKLAQLPATEFDLVIADNGKAIPAQRGLKLTSNQHWDIMFEPGSWYVRNKKISLVLPFALIEKGQNCTHQGTIIIESDQAGYQIATETCKYLQFNAQGFADISISNKGTGSSKSVTLKYAKELLNRLPEESIFGASKDDSKLDDSVLSQSAYIEPSSISVYGAVIDATHYVSGCPTRAANFSDCSHVPLPGYSLAKSIIGGIGLMRLEALYPGAQNLLVKDLIPECVAWADISLKHLLNNTTGRYGSKYPHRDEAKHLFAFFEEPSVKAKTEHACNRYRTKAKPGEQWVYHTTEFWLLGVAMQNFWQQKHGKDKDFYTDLLMPIWADLGLSPLLDAPHREQNQPSTGWGLMLLRSDIAKLASALSASDPILTKLLDKSMLDRAMQKDVSDRGVTAGAADLKFNNGFWAWDAGPSLDCANSQWLPFMSGYGGISVVLLPDGDAYYYFSDSGVFRFTEVIQHLNKINPIC